MSRSEQTEHWTEAARRALDKADDWILKELKTPSDENARFLATLERPSDKIMALVGFYTAEHTDEFTKIAEGHRRDPQTRLIAESWQDAYLLLINETDKIHRSANAYLREVGLATQTNDDSDLMLKSQHRTYYPKCCEHLEIEDTTTLFKDSLDALITKAMNHYSHEVNLKYQRLISNWGLDTHKELAFVLRLILDLSSTVDRRGRASAPLKDVNAALEKLIAIDDRKRTQLLELAEHFDNQYHALNLHTQTTTGKTSGKFNDALRRMHRSIVRELLTNQLSPRVHAADARSEYDRKMDEAMLDHYRENETALEEAEELALLRSEITEESIIPAISQQNWLLQCNDFIQQTKRVIEESALNTDSKRAIAQYLKQAIEPMTREAKQSIDDGTPTGDELKLFFAKLTELKTTISKYTTAYNELYTCTQQQDGSPNNPLKTNGRALLDAVAEAHQSQSEGADTTTKLTNLLTNAAQVVRNPNTDTINSLGTSITPLKKYQRNRAFRIVAGIALCLLGAACIVASAAAIACSKGTLAPVAVEGIKFGVTKFAIGAGILGAATGITAFCARKTRWFKTRLFRKASDLKTSAARASSDTEREGLLAVGSPTVLSDSDSGFGSGPSSPITEGSGERLFHTDDSSRGQREIEGLLTGERGSAVSGSDSGSDSGLIRRHSSPITEGSREPLTHTTDELISMHRSGIMSVGEFKIIETLQHRNTGLETSEREKESINLYFQEAGVTLDDAPRSCSLVHG